MVGCRRDQREEAAHSKLWSQARRGWGEGGRGESGCGVGVCVSDERRGWWDTVIGLCTV